MVAQEGTAALLKVSADAYIYKESLFLLTWELKCASILSVASWVWVTKTLTDNKVKKLNSAIGKALWGPELGHHSRQQKQKWPDPTERFMLQFQIHERASPLKWSHFRRKNVGDCWVDCMKLFDKVSCEVMKSVCLPCRALLSRQAQKKP